MKETLYRKKYINMADYSVVYKKGHYPREPQYIGNLVNTFFMPYSTPLSRLQQVFELSRTVFTDDVRTLLEQLLFQPPPYQYYRGELYFSFEAEASYGTYTKLQGINEHHIIAQEHGGTDHKDNTIILQRNKHHALHALWQIALPHQQLLAILEGYKEVWSPEFYSLAKALLEPMSLEKSYPLHIRGNMQPREKSPEQLSKDKSYRLWKKILQKERKQKII